MARSVDARVRQAVEDSSFDPVHPPAPAVPAERWWGNHLGEMRWQLELARLLVDPVYRGEDVPRGDGAPVVLIPGFLAGDPRSRSCVAGCAAWDTRRAAPASSPTSIARIAR